MEWLGLALLAGVALLMLTTGLPAVVVLFAMAACGALLGSLGGAIPAQLSGMLPARIVSLLENDLLQALPLYVLMGLLLDRLPVADVLYRGLNALQPRKRGAPLTSAVALGALLGPMNGSVGASVLGLRRVIAPRLDAERVPAAQRDAVVAVASTLGVLVPPSLVLILLGDAMMAAHTYASTLSGRHQRILNTADIFHAALLPAALFLLVCLVLAAWSGRRAEALPPREPMRPREWLLAGASLTALVGLLGGVASGYFFPVEAAALGALALFLAGLCSGRLPPAVLRPLLRDALATTGALFALLLAATSLTLVLRLLGTDRLVGQLIAAIPGQDTLAVAVTLGMIGLCAFVLDAFEIIFVIVPIVVPPLLVRVADARWVALLVLLTLQASFLLPPFGYALMMVRNAARVPPPWRAFLRALAPFIAAQWLLLALVVLQPGLAHVGDREAGAAALPQTDPTSELGQLLDDNLRR